MNNHQNELPDIVLSDLNMPGKNGYEIIEAFKENPRWSHIPVVITSTSSTPTIINKCMAAGAADYVVKPDTFIEYGPYIKHFYGRIKEKNLVKAWKESFIHHRKWKSLHLRRSWHQLQIVKHRSAATPERLSIHRDHQIVWTVFV